MTQFLAQRTIAGLAAHPDGDGVKILSKIPVGTAVVVDVKDPRRRSSQQSRWFFALLTKVLANQEYFQSVDQLRWALAIKLGYVERIRLKGGVVYQVPKSWAFHKMSQEEFSRLIDDTIDFLTTEVIPGLGKTELLVAVDEMLGGPPNMGD